jgi:FkbM family methyltransferase
MFLDIRNSDPEFRPGCIFDIGANVGQTVQGLRRVWPDVEIHAFEPVGSTFAKLAENVATDARVHPHRLAFGSRPGKARMLARPLGVMNRIIHAPGPAMPIEEVEVVAGDAFCAAHGIARIGLLKIDTEGHDLEVLAGFREMLAGRRIDYVEVECAVAPTNTMHVPFGRLADFLFAFGYGLFNLYAGSRANITQRTRERGIWYGNAVFVAERWPEDAVPLASPAPAPGAGTAPAAGSAIGTGSMP